MTLPGETNKSGPRVEWLHGGRYQVLGLPRVSPPFISRAEAEKWLRSELQRLPESRRPRERRCMCCGASFMSQGIHNRLCDPCRHRSDGGSLTIAANATGKVRRAARGA